MIESAIAFLALYLLTWPALLVLCILGIFSESNDSRGWAVFYAIIAGVCSVFYFSLPIRTMLYSVGAYFIVGVIWSFWRYKQYVTETVEKFKNDSVDELPSPYAYERFKARIDYKKMVDTIVAWIIVWPFSFIESMIGDLIRFVKSLIKNVFNKVYQNIYNNAIKDFTAYEKKVAAYENDTEKVNNRL